MSFFNSITKIFDNKSNDKILGVDIGSSSIKVVQLSLKKGVAVLDTFGEISLSVYANKEIGKSVSLGEEKIAEALSDLIKEAQADADKVAFAIPLKSTLMFNLKLAKSIDKDKLDYVVRIESRKYIPVPMAEVQLDWSIIPSANQKEKESEMHNILVVAIHKETLNKYANIATRIGLDLRFLEVETFSTMRSVIKHDRNTTAIVDIGSSITKFYIVELGIIRKSHIINIGSSKMLSNYINNNNNNNPAIANGEVNGNAAKLLRENIINDKDIPIDLVRIINQVRKAIVEYQKNNKKNVTDLVITGGGSLFKNITSYVKKELALEVREADPFSKVSNPAFLDEPLKEAGPEFAVAVGIALRGLKS